MTDWDKISFGGAKVHNYLHNLPLLRKKPNFDFINSHPACISQE